MAERLNRLLLQGPRIQRSSIGSPTTTSSPKSRLIWFLIKDPFQSLWFIFIFRRNFTIYKRNSTKFVKKNKKGICDQIVFQDFISSNFLKIYQIINSKLPTRFIYKSRVNNITTSMMTIEKASLYTRHITK